MLLPDVSRYTELARSASAAGKATKRERDANVTTGAGVVCRDALA